MNTNTNVMPRYGKSKRALQIGVTATTFLTLAIWVGPNRACFFIAVAAILATWIWLGRRFPFVGMFSILVLCNLISGGRWR